MSKQAFLAQLQERLCGLPQEDIAERLSFYSEMIDDRIEDGLSEEEAVSAIGSIDEITEQILSETPITKLVKEKVRSNGKMKAWNIILLVLGFPLWFPLLVAAFAVLLSLYISLWAIVISLWAADLAIAVSAVAGIIGGIVYLCMGQATTGLLLISAGLVLAGLSIPLFYGCLYATKGTAILAKKIVLGIKKLFVGNKQ